MHLFNFINDFSKQHKELLWKNINEESNLSVIKIAERNMARIFE
jgi:hypothetical protein